MRRARARWQWSAARLSALGGLGCTCTCTLCASCTVVKKGSLPRIHGGVHHAQCAWPGPCRLCCTFMTSAIAHATATLRLRTRTAAPARVPAHVESQPPPQPPPQPPACAIARAAAAARMHTESSPPVPTLQPLARRAATSVGPFDRQRSAGRRSVWSPSSSSSSMPLRVHAPRRSPLPPAEPPCVTSCASPTAGASRRIQPALLLSARLSTRRSRSPWAPRRRS